MDKVPLQLCFKKIVYYFAQNKEKEKKVVLRPSLGVFIYICAFTSFLKGDLSILVPAYMLSLAPRILSHFGSNVDLLELLINGYFLSS